MGAIEFSRANLPPLLCVELLLFDSPNCMFWFRQLCWDLGFSPLFPSGAVVVPHSPRPASPVTDLQSDPTEVPDASFFRRNLVRERGPPLEVDKQFCPCRLLQSAAVSKLDPMEKELWRRLETYFGPGCRHLPFIQ